jgi:glycosyltransferase involved in cell wall biosynthesis
MAKLFSIVTVCLNAGNRLSRTIESVLSQEFDSFHYVVKDGLSTDNSALAWAGADRVQWIALSDSGIYDAMNQALEYCEGEYVCFLNAGDVFHSPRTLSLVAEYIRKYPAKSMYIGHARLGQITKTHPKRFSPAFLYEGHICHQAAFVKRQLYLSEGGFNVAYRFLADKDFFIRAIRVKREPYQVLPLVVCDYDLSGITARKEIQYLKDQELRRIQNEYFTLRNRIWIWLYLFLLVKPNFFLRSLLRKTVKRW